MQYAFNDFGIRQVAQLLGKTGDEAYYANRVRLLYRPLIPIDLYVPPSLRYHIVLGEQFDATQSGSDN